MLLVAAWLGTSIVAVVLSLLIYGDLSHYFGERRFGTYASVAMLFGGAHASFRLSRRLGTDPFSRLWWIGAVGLAYMGLDDLFTIHEGVDRGVHLLFGWNREHPVTDRIDDVIVIAYPLFAATAGWRWRHQLATLPWMLWCLIIATLLFTGMVVIDWLDVSTVVEESLKIAAGGAILAAILAAEEELMSETERRRPQPFLASGVANSTNADRRR